LGTWTTGKARKWRGWGVNPYKGGKGGRSPRSSFIPQTANLTGRVWLLEARGAWTPLPPNKGGEKVLPDLNTGLTYVGIYGT
jgi:hypothetical protein